MFKKLNIFFEADSHVNTVVCTGFFDNWNASIKMEPQPIDSNQNKRKFIFTLDVCENDTEVVVKFIVDGVWTLSTNYDTVFSGPFQNNIIHVPAEHEINNANLVDTITTLLEKREETKGDLNINSESTWDSAIDVLSNQHEVIKTPSKPNSNKKARRKQKRGKSSKQNMTKTKANGKKQRKAKNNRHGKRKGKGNRKGKNGKF